MKQGSVLYERVVLYHTYVGMEAAITQNYCSALTVLEVLVFVERHFIGGTKFR